MKNEALTIRDSRLNRFKVLALLAVLMAGAGACSHFGVPLQGSGVTLEVGPTRTYRTIQAAADVAKPGDTVLIDPGVYREWVKPTVAGTKDAPITFRAREPGKTVISGADVLTGWTKRPDGFWEKKLALVDFAGKFNPFVDMLGGDWFWGQGLRHPRTALLFNGRRLKFCQKTADVSTGGYALETDGSFGRIVAAFSGDPATGCVEFVVRPACFYPARRHCDYQIVDGLELRDAGPSWAPPTAEQMGIIGTHWSRGWEIRSCTIHGSCASGVTLGKHGDEWDNRAGTAEGYHGTIRRAVSNGLDRVGHHLVANCTIYDCDQVGICGSLGAVFSTVRDCHIHHCYWQKAFRGAEQGGIKIHAAVNFTVSGCHIHHCGATGGVWLDWMAQGALVKDCVLHDNERDLFFEVDHGPVTVRNCTLLSDLACVANSQSVCFLNNRIAGSFKLLKDPRETPYFVRHTTTVAKWNQHCRYGDFRAYNNVMARPFPTESLVKEWPMIQSGNVIVPRESWRINGDGVQFAVSEEEKRAIEAALATPPPKLAESVVTHQEFRL